MFEQNESVLLWQVQRDGGVRFSAFFEIKGELESYIQKKMLE